MTAAHRRSIRAALTAGVALGAALALSACGDTPQSSQETPQNTLQADGSDTVAPPEREDPVFVPIPGSTTGLIGDGGAASEGAAYLQPNQDGDTALERRGYPAATELADRLVSGRYLDAYRTVAPRLRELSGDIPVTNTALQTNCPGGGGATVARANAGEPGQPVALRFVFEGCRIDGVRFDGELQQTQSLTGSRFRDGTELLSRFDALALVDRDGTQVIVSGTLTDTTSILANPTCGISPAITQNLMLALDSVNIESAADGRITLDSVRYTSRDDDGFGDRDDCERARRFSFDGSAMATLVDEPGGPVVIDLSKSGALLREPTDDEPAGGEARLRARADDGATLELSVSDDEAGLAQFDLTVGDVAVSFVDLFTFEP